MSRVEQIDLVPIREAPFLHARAVANQVRTVLLHVIAQAVRRVLVDVQDLGEVRERHDVQLFERKTIALEIRFTVYGEYKRIQFE